MDENVLKNIIETGKIIRKKYIALKTGKIQDAATYERIFEPITTPLKSIIAPLKPNKNAFLTKMKKSSSTKPTPSLSASSTEGDEDFKTASSEEEEAEAAAVVKRKYQPALSTSAKPQSSMLMEKSVTKDEEEDTTDLNSTFELSSTDLYMNKIKRLFNQTDIDNRYGIRYDKNNSTWKLGSEEVKIAEKYLFINSEKYFLTPGLRELIFRRIPQRYTENDCVAYRKIVNDTNLLRRDFDSGKQLAGNRSVKYHLIKQRLLSNKKRKLVKSSAEGSGLMQYSDNKIDYIYWDDPNELVDRLKLLIASQDVGHTNHNNEITSILEELTERNIIV